MFHPQISNCQAGQFETVSPNGQMPTFPIRQTYGIVSDRHLILRVTIYCLREGFCGDM